VPGERILIVDDNPAGLKLVAYLLEINGYEVTTAPDARSALDAARSHLPAVILMDIQLPDMDGLEAVRQLRSTSSSQKTLIFALTAHAMKGDAERAFAAGCDGYITKPIDTRTLPGIIRRALASHRVS